MVEDLELAKERSVPQLACEALWFVAHTATAVLTLLALVTAFYLLHVDPDAPNPKLLATALAFLVPMAGGFLIPSRRCADPAVYVWISGLLTFAVVSVWVLDLPTGAGLCDHCGAPEKLFRTFFDIEHGSGLMGGDGLLVGTWIPLSMSGYALGAKLARR